jgi:hypothetical protein
MGDVGGADANGNGGNGSNGGNGEGDGGYARGGVVGHCYACGGTVHHAAGGMQCANCGMRGGPLSRVGANMTGGGKVDQRQLGRPNPPGPDDGTAFLDDGEFVVRASQVPKYLPMLKAMNAGTFPAKGYAQGGMAIATRKLKGADFGQPGIMQKAPHEPWFWGPWSDEHELKEPMENLAHGGIVGRPPQSSYAYPRDEAVEDGTKDPHWPEGHRNVYDYSFAQGGQFQGGPPMSGPQYGPVPPMTASPSIVSNDDNNYGSDMDADEMGGMDDYDEDDGGMDWGAQAQQTAPNNAPGMDMMRPGMQGQEITPQAVMQNLMTMPPEQRQLLQVELSNPATMGAISSLFGDAFIPVLLAALQGGGQPMMPMGADQGQPQGQDQGMPAPPSPAPTGAPPGPVGPAGGGDTGMGAYAQGGMARMHSAGAPPGAPGPMNPPQRPGLPFQPHPNGMMRRSPLAGVGMAPGGGYAG